MVLFDIFRAAALAAVLALAAQSASAQAPGGGGAGESAGGQAPPAQEPPLASNPALDAKLFYQILLAEISTRMGDAASGQALMLEAARKSANAQLYQRAVDIALQSRSGEQALTAVKAWRAALPQSREAARNLLQILIALNRIAETPELLRQELARESGPTKAAALSALPQLYWRSSDKALAARVVEQALTDELAAPDTGPLAWAALARLRLAAGERGGALAAARKAWEAGGEGAVRLALELMEKNIAQAEPIVTGALVNRPDPELRMAYARVLLGQQRYADAARQLEAVTREKPDLAEAWLVIATLQFQDRRLPEAQASLQRFMDLAQAGGADGADADAPPRNKGLTQAYLLHAQIAERQKDYAAAENWLARIDQADEVLSVHMLRASMLARQGKLAQARALLRNLPGGTPQERRMKLLAEVQLLREQHLYQEAYKVQGALVALTPGDAELLYEQAMLAEKAGRPEQMEQLLRQVIARQPQYHHAYNALGYSLADRGTRLDEARRLIVKALEFAPGDPFIMDSMGWVEFRLGNKASARRHLEAAYRARPDAEIAAHLGEVLWSMGERDDASRIWREGQRSSPGNDTLMETLKRLGVSL